MKPYSKQPISEQTSLYGIGISNKRDLIDNKRNHIELKSGHQTYIKVLPRMVTTSKEFEGLSLDERDCKMPYEADGLRTLKDYTRVGC